MLDHWISIVWHGNAYGMTLATTEALLQLKTHFLKQIMIMRSGRGQLYDRGNTNMILQHRMNLHTAFLLIALRRPAYTLEGVIKKGNRS